MQMENLFYQLMELSPGILKSLGQSGDDKNLLVFFSIIRVKLTNHLLILLTSHDNLFYFIFKVF